MKLTAFDLAFAPAERFGVLVVPSDEGFNGLAQLIFGFEACSVEGLALQQAEHDFDLVQPTGRSRCEMKLEPSRPEDFHPEALTDSGREPLDSSGSCHPLKAAAPRHNQSVPPVAS